MPDPFHQATISHPLGYHIQRTSRLLLRPLTVADAFALHAIRRNFSTMQWTSKRPETSISETYAWIEDKILRAPESIWSFCIELLSEEERLKPELRRVLMGQEGPIIGTIGAAGGPEFGYLLHPVFEGRGYGSEAVRAFLEMFWRVVPAARVSSTERKTTELIEAEARTAREALPDPPLSDLECKALKDGLSSYNERRKSPPQFKDGWDYVEAVTDAENVRSVRMLENLGFTLWSSIKDDFDSVNMGLRSTKAFRLARPGTTLGIPVGPFQLD